MFSKYLPFKLMLDLHNKYKDNMKEITLTILNEQEKNINFSLINHLNLDLSDAILNDVNITDHIP